MSTQKQAFDFFPDSSKTPGVPEAAAIVKGLQDETEAGIQAGYGKNIVNMGLGGLALGAGGMGLYHLLKALKKPTKKDKKYEPLLSGAPMVAKQADEKTAGMDEIYKFVGGLLPKDAVPSFGGGGGAGGGDLSTAPNATVSDPSTYRPNWAALGAIGAGALGLYGGGKLVNTLMARKKKRDNELDIEDAKKEYYAALTGKSAAALDSAFDVYQEKKASGFSEIADGVNSFFTRTVPQTAHAGLLLTLLGSGAVGAKYMYDRTRARNKGDNIAKAQASRVRMKNLPTTWVDPEELARVKELATAQPHE